MKTLTNRIEMTRRDLLKALGGGVLVLACGPSILAQESGRRGGGGQASRQISAWIHIGVDGKVTAMTGKVEVGQNARTSLTQAVAEELRVPIDKVNMIMGDTDLVPFDQGTFGSRTTPSMVPQLRQAAAAARERLIDLAAEKWAVDRKSLRVSDGKVSDVAGNSATYGELAKGQPLDQPIPAEIVLAPIGEWKALGAPATKVNGRAVVTGRHQFTSDLRRPGMLYAKVLRPPSIGAEITASNITKAESMQDVKVVREGDFIAVAAPTLRQAERALFAVEAEWKEEPGPSSKNLVDVLRGPTRPTMAASGDKKLEATYTAAYIAHVPLEPRAALAEWDGKKMTVHTGTQRPFGVRGEVAQALGLPESQVRVIVPDTGSGYGGKHSGEAAVEAARIAKSVGKPVLLVWTRQEEFTFAYFRPGGVIEVSCGAKTDGTLASWEFHNYNSGGSGIASPYEVPSPRTQFHRSESPMRQGSYRGLAATFNHFARECHIDEMAVALGIGPLEFRLKNLREPRLKAVLQAAADTFGWGKSRAPANHGYGLACGTEKGSFVATVAEVAIDQATKVVRVVRAVTAFECGAILNPLQLENQVLGSVIQGIGGALFEQIDFDNNKVETDRLSRYRVPRFQDTPAIETVLLNRKDLPSAGAGETPIVTIAPAIGNAIFDATGQRLRSLPMKLT